LQQSADIHSQSKALRIIPYFCTTLAGQTKRPNYQIIIRSITQKLALLPDFTLAQLAQDRYNKAQRPPKKKLEEEDWEKLLKNLVKQEINSSKIVFLVDALDKCDSSSPSAAERLLRFFKELVNEYPHVYFLCSSHPHVPVGTYFETETVYNVDAIPSVTGEEMENFIDTEIKSRKADIKDSIFCKLIVLSTPGGHIIEANNGRSREGMRESVRIIERIVDRLCRRNVQFPSSNQIISLTGIGSFGFKFG
jgi:hypothetical protein